MFKRLHTYALIFFVTLGASSGTGHAAPATEVEKFITSLGNKVLTLLNDKSIDAPKKEEMLKSIFRDNVDTDWIGQFVLGKYWREASPEQQKKYLGLYREFLIQSYTGRFKDYSGESFKITGSLDEGDDKYLLNTEIVRPQSASVLVDYKVRGKGASMKVYDIVVEGVSLISTQRSEFTSVISRKGLDALITALDKKVNKAAS
jgi:phospholipid transport system substrate-binding protein